MKIILASASPRRRELMKLIADDFECMPADVDETVSPDVPPDDVPLILAEKKALKILEDHSEKDILIIGCDTVVITEDVIYGKPADAADAFNMLKSLSGRTHNVVTGVSLCYIDGSGGFYKKNFADTSYVTFYPLSDSEINDYTATGEPFDKAGAYGIQEKGAMLVEKINGDYNNIVGMPAARIAREIKALVNEPNNKKD